MKVKVTYRDVNTNEFIEIIMEHYMVNNEQLLPEEDKERWQNFTEGRLLEREVINLENPNT